MKVTYNSHNFPNTYGRKFQGSNNLNFSVHELMWAAITVGRANFIDVISNGIYSQYEILYRASILVANLTQYRGNLVKSSAYNHLDPSEKSAVSYFFGLTFSKLISEKLLYIPWLLHIDVYRDQFLRGGQAFGFGSSQSRPDLIGLDLGRDWVVIESKGRTNSMPAHLLSKAKAQTQNLRSIGGVPPNLRVAIVSHFKKGILTIDWADPVGSNDESFELKTDIKQFLMEYYRIVFNILDSNEKDVQESQGYLIYTFESIDLTIGLDKKTFNAYKTDNIDNITLKNDYQGSHNINNQDVFIGSDGILVGIGKNWVELFNKE